MKKFLCVLFCLVFTALALVGCGDVERDDWLNDEYKDYETDNSVPEISLNLYVIVEDKTELEGAVPSDTTGKIGVVTQAINTVNNAIKDFTSTNYHSEVNVIYVKESDYDTVVYDAVVAENGAANAANIVLVNSYELMQKLYATGKLCPLDSYLDTTSFGKLNNDAVIPQALMAASKIDEVSAEGKKIQTLYSIPNNHVVGRYEYLVINKKAAQDLKFDETTVRSFNSYDAAASLIEAVENSSYRLSDVISLVPGSYEDRFVYEEQGYYCNVVNNPVADKHEAFKSAFAVVKRDTNPNDKVDIDERAMEIIYNINMNEALRNLLQYGVVGSNYTIENGVVERNDGINGYYMNLLYTGNIFNAYYCDEIGWDAETKANASMQNADSVAPQKVVVQGESEK